MTFAEKLTALRKKSGDSQEQLAGRLGVTRQSVSKWESGAALPELAKLIALSELFGVSIDYLVKDTVTEDMQQKGPDAVQLAEKLENLRRRVDPDLYHYTSRVKLFGLPLVCVRFSRDRGPTRSSTAVGILAVGNFAVGVVSVGLISVGAFSLGMIAVGLLALGGVAMGLAAFGGVAIGVLAIGGSALGVYAAGGAAAGKEIAVGGAAAAKTAAGIDADGIHTMLLRRDTAAAEVEAFLRLHHPKLWPLLVRLLAWCGA